MAPTGENENDQYPGSSSVDSWEWGDLLQYYGAQPSSFVVDALLPPDATALGERMPNSMLLHITPGASVHSSATVDFASPAEAYFAKNFLQLQSTVTTSAPGTAPLLSSWYTLQDSQVLRLNGSVPIESAPYAVKVATLDPATRAEGLLAYAMRSGNSSGSGARPAGPSRATLPIAPALQKKCAEARLGECSVC